MVKVLIAAISAATLHAQVPSSRTIDSNRHVWMSYSGDHPVKGRWGVHFDAQWRRSDMGTEWQQYQLRPAVNFEASRSVTLTLGYAFTRTYPYGDFPVARAIPEHRIYQQAIVRQRLGAARLSHRIRWEERFIRYPQNLDRSFTYQNRFRYSLKADIPLVGENGHLRWYLPVFNEILIGLPPNYGARPWDQNRAFAGIGRAFGGAGRLEAGYLHQLIGQRNGRVFESNHTLLVTFTSTVPLGAIFRRR